MTAAPVGGAPPGGQHLHHKHCKRRLQSDRTMRQGERCVQRLTFGVCLSVAGESSRPARALGSAVGRALTQVATGAAHVSFDTRRALVGLKMVQLQPGVLFQYEVQLAGRCLRDLARLFPHLGLER